jgi:hypothetical protein
MFMPIIYSSLLLHLFKVSRAMVHAMEGDLQEIDSDLISMLRRYVTLRDWQLQVFMVAEQLGESLPKGKSPRSLLEWPYIGWRQRNVLMLRGFLGHAELLERDD